MYGSFDYAQRQLLRTHVYSIHALFAPCFHVTLTAAFVYGSKHPLSTFVLAPCFFKKITFDHYMCYGNIELNSNVSIQSWLTILYVLEPTWSCALVLTCNVTLAHQMCAHVPWFHIVAPWSLMISTPCGFHFPCFNYIMSKPQPLSIACVHCVAQVQQRLLLKRCIQIL